MKSKISRNSFDPTKRYSGVYQQQGSLITDADWNEMQDIIRTNMENALQDVVGQGIPETSRGVSIPQGLKEADRTQIYFPGGHVYVDGTLVDAPNDLYSSPFGDFPDAPGGSLKVGDTIYLDIWDREVLPSEEKTLRDSALDSAETCTRTQRVVQLKVFPSTAGAQFNPKALTPTVQVGDFILRLRANPELGIPISPNHVFRMEVHAVKQPKDSKFYGITELHLKWSTENGAESYVSSEAPDQDHFYLDGFCFEYYTRTAELHRGIHLDEGWQPKRGVIREERDDTLIAEDVFVRRWDGHCLVKFTIDNTTGKMTATEISGCDRGTPLKQREWQPNELHGAVQIQSGEGGRPCLLIYTANLILNLALTPVPSSFVPLNGHYLVAGDYWVATVREHWIALTTRPVAITPQGDLTEGPRAGIHHKYLALGDVARDDQGFLYIKNRQNAFGSLSQLTAQIQQIATSYPTWETLRSRSSSSDIGSSAIKETNITEGTIYQQLTQIAKEYVTQADLGAETGVRMVGGLLNNLDKRYPQKAEIENSGFFFLCGESDVGKIPLPGDNRKTLEQQKILSFNQSVWSVSWWFQTMEYDPINKNLREIDQRLRLGPYIEIVGQDVYQIYVEHHTHPSGSEGIAFRSEKLPPNRVLLIRTRVLCI